MSIDRCIMQGLFVVLSALLLASCTADRGDALRQKVEQKAGQKMPNKLQRSVAITIDDLPSSGVRSLAQKKQLTESLIRKLLAAKAPAIGFVNERKLGKKAPKSHNVELLQAWVNAGMTLGNHTYSHPKFFDTSLDDFKEQVLRGEKVTKRLFTPENGGPRYFRHPYLNTGPDMQTRLEFEAFLTEHNYNVAPVTLDNSEWIYSKAYNIAIKMSDAQLQERIGQDYVRYMLTTFDFYETLSQDLFGRNIAHTLLIHANQINADYIDQLLSEVAKRGYEFVSLQDALKDPAYQHEDSYVGVSGLSWLQRWWMSEGNVMRDEPEVSAWVSEVASSKK